MSWGKCIFNFLKRRYEIPYVIFWGSAFKERIVHISECANRLKK